jgi:mono/diheme cytochrome c family protein
METPMNRRRATLTIPSLLPLLLLAWGCNKPQDDANQAPAGPAPQATTMPAETAAPSGAFGDGPGAAEAETIFKTRCSTCHGVDGHGTGPASIALNPKPRNYTDVTWQRSVTDDHIRETIVKGGAAVGKSPLMAPNPDLADKPAVVDALVLKVRSFATGIDAGVALAPSASAPAASAAKPAAAKK